MNDSVPTPGTWSEREERVWKAWLNKNDAKDKAQFARTAKLAGIAAMIGLVLIFFWT